MSAFTKMHRRFRRICVDRGVKMVVVLREMLEHKYV